MNSIRTPIHTTRVVFCALASIALLATASAVAVPQPADSDSFTPGWHADAIRVANLGPAPGIPGRDRYVLAGMPSGDFVLVQRVGDKAQLLDTAVVTVHSGIENHYVFLEAGLGKVFALPVKDVPAAKNVGVSSPH